MGRGRGAIHVGEEDERKYDEEFRSCDGRMTTTTPTLDLRSLHPVFYWN